MNDFIRFLKLPFSSKIMVICLCLGTLLMLIHFTFPDEEYIFLVGFFYVPIATIINGLVALFLCYKIVTVSKENTKKYIIELLILCINIPIAGIYIYLFILNNQFINF